MKKTEHDKVVSLLKKEQQAEIKGIKHYYEGQLAELQKVIDRYTGALDAQDAEMATNFQYRDATEMTQALETMGNGGLIFQTRVAEQVPNMHRAIQSNLYRLALKILAALAVQDVAQVDERNQFAVSGARRIVGACRSEFM